MRRWWPGRPSASAANGAGSTESGPALAEVSQLMEALAKCTQQIEQMQNAFMERRPLGEPAVAAQYLHRSIHVGSVQPATVANDTGASATADATDNGSSSS